jgi:hypothetical protein
VKEVNNEPQQQRGSWAAFVRAVRRSFYVLTVIAVLIVGLIVAGVVIENRKNQKEEADAKKRIPPDKIALIFSVAEQGTTGKFEAKGRIKNSSDFDLSELEILFSIRDCFPESMEGGIKAFSQERLASAMPLRIGGDGQPIFRVSLSVPMQFVEGGKPISRPPADYPDFDVPGIGLIEVPDGMGINEKVAAMTKYIQGCEIVGQSRLSLRNTVPANQSRDFIDVVDFNLVNPPHGMFTITYTIVSTKGRAPQVTAR